MTALNTPGQSKNANRINTLGMLPRTMNGQRHHTTIRRLMVLALTALTIAPTQSFVVGPLPRQQVRDQLVSFSSAKETIHKAKPSKVEDPDGPTPVLEPPKIPTVDPETIDGLKEITRVEDLHVAVPGQPWRRGDTAGCHAPISAEWRKEAEELIYFAVDFVGGKVLDITWYLTVLLVTLDDEVMPPKDLLKDRGVPIDVVDPEMPMYYDPLDPNPDPIDTDEDRVVYVRETPEQKADAEDRRRRMYVKQDADDDPNESHIPDIGMDEAPLYMNEEVQEDFAGLVADKMAERAAENPKPFNFAALNTDTAALSTIAQAILDALEPYEEKLEILSRHELMLTSPNPMPDVLETQKQFDAYRDQHVVVETFDPFNSNRTLKGQLVDRNAMDLLLNIKGRLVTVPLNFVKRVRVPPQPYVDEEMEEEDSEGEIEEVTPEVGNRFMP